MAKVEFVRVPGRSSQIFWFSDGVEEYLLNHLITSELILK